MEEDYRRMEERIVNRLVNNRLQRLQVEIIIRFIEIEYDITLTDIRRSGQKMEIAEIRHLLSYLLYTIAGLRTKEVADEVGRSIPTVTYEINSVRKKMSAYPRYDKLVSLIMKELSIIIDKILEKEHKKRIERIMSNENLSLDNLGFIE